MGIEEIRAKTGAACREFNVKRLALFGSAARGDSEAGSDLDLLVEFKAPQARPAKQFFGLLHRFEDEFGCRIDLLTVSGLRSPHFRKQVLEEKVPLYEG